MSARLLVGLFVFVGASWLSLEIFQPGPKASVHEVAVTRPVFVIVVTIIAVAVTTEIVRARTAARERSGLDDVGAPELD
ncbi:hypothetical protein [Demequina pelophila]|uniref:hypothetical protein n=1 Tax=Demequina pelophila TaxID=1638984 RepID=UPI00078168B6|nr:hypothetical protein [Demequina pelophila]